MVKDEPQPSLDNLFFYIPIDTYDNVYCLIDDEEGHRDIVKMTKDHVHKDYQVYKPSLKSYLECQNGCVKIRVLLCKNEEYIQSDFIEVQLDFDKFKQTSTLIFLDQTFEKIKSLTEMNMQIYKDILEVTGK